MSREAQEALVNEFRAALLADPEMVVEFAAALRTGEVPPSAVARRKYDEEAERRTRLQRIQHRLRLRREKSARYDARHREERRAARAEYVAANPDAVAEAQRKYRASAKGKATKARRDAEYYERNREAVRERQRAYRARKRAERDSANSS